MSKTKLFLITLFALIITAGVGALASFIHIKNSIYKSFGDPGKVKEFTIKSGEGVKSVSGRLESEGLVSSDFIFQIYVWQQSAGGKIQAGEYEILTGANMSVILEMFVGGKVKPDIFRITIPEGFSSRQIVERIKNQESGIKGDIELAAREVQRLKEKYWFLQDDKIKSLEGYLFPDTYEFSIDVEAESIVKKMLDNFGRKIELLQNQVESNKMSLYEILTLASIVEKEVSSAEDMRIVAGLFLRRLEIRMLLQSDATVNYITQKGDPAPTYKDLEAESPYNTYKYAGLPPGPICNPGVKAIEAVLNPQKTDYLYFLTPSGKPTVYSRTNAEHEANKQKWLK